MQARFIHKGLLIDYTPSSAVSAGTPISQNGYVGIPSLDIAADALGALAVTGVFDIVKVSGALAIGDIVGWDNDGDPVGGTAGTGAATKTLSDADFVLGTVIATALETGTVARVQLNQFPGSKILESFPAIAAIADLDQTISATYDQAEVQAISDKVDAILAALRSAGIIATA